jgi:branched-chain amino acid transport system permease protein
MMDVIQQVVSALSLGTTYAIYALGLAVVFSIGRVINFAHGELITVAAWMVYALSSVVWPVAALAALLAAAIVAVLIERLAVRPMRGADPTTVLAATFAMSILVQNVILIVSGSEPRGVSFGSSLVKPVRIGELAIPAVEIVNLVVGATLLLGVTLFLTRTPLGIQIRAAGADLAMARALGVRVSRVTLVAFILSGLLAGVASLLLVVQRGTVNFSLGQQPLLIAFIAIVLGGMGSLVGAVSGGLILGIVTVVLQVVLPDSAAPYRDAFVYALVILLLLTRPQGIMGRDALSERV